MNREFFKCRDLRLFNVRNTGLGAQPRLLVFVVGHTTRPLDGNADQFGVFDKNPGAFIAVTTGPSASFLTGGKVGINDHLPALGHLTPIPILLE